MFFQFLKEWVKSNIGFYILLVLLFLLVRVVHPAGIIEPTAGTSTGHIRLTTQTLQPERFGAWVDPITKLIGTRLTDCALMPNPASNRNNPQAHNGTQTTGLYNGYSRFISISYDNKYFIAYDTDGGCYWHTMQAPTQWGMLKQADGKPILGEAVELRLDTSRAADSYDLVWYWGADGKTYRYQHFLQGPQSEKIWFTQKETHVHSGDCNASADNRYVADAFIYDSSKTQPVVGVSVLDLYMRKRLPGCAVYDLNLAGVYMNGCSVSPDGKWLQAQLDFYRLDDLQTSTTYPPSRRGAINGGHGGWCWLNGRSGWFWSESRNSYFQYYDIEADTIMPVMKYKELDPSEVTSTHSCSIINSQIEGVAIVSTYDTMRYPFSNSVFMIELKPINTALHPWYYSDHNSSRYSPSATVQTNASTLWSKSWVPVAQWPRVNRLFNTENVGTNAKGYFAQCFASMNFDGTTLIYGGNWNGLDNLEEYSFDITGEYTHLTGKQIGTPVPTPVVIKTVTLTPKATQMVTYLKDMTGEYAGDSYEMLCKPITPTSTLAVQSMLVQVDLTTVPTNAVIVASTMTLTKHPKSEYGFVTKGHDGVPARRLLINQSFTPIWRLPGITANEVRTAASYKYMIRDGVTTARWSNILSTPVNPYEKWDGNVTTVMEPITSDTERLNFSITGLTSSFSIKRLVQGSVGGLLQFALDSAQASSKDQFPKQGYTTPQYYVRGAFYGVGAADPNVRPSIKVAYYEK
jgi:hypothetical protein